MKANRIIGNLNGVAGALLLAGFLFAPRPASAQMPESIQLGVNQQRTVDFPEDVKSATPSDPSVVGLQGIGQRQLIVRGLKAGSATVDFDLRSGQRGQIAIEVGQSILPAIKEMLDQQLDEIVGVETVVNESLGFVQIQGTVRLGESYDRVKEVVAGLPERFRNQVHNAVQIKIDLAMAQKVVETYLSQCNIESPSANISDRRLVIGGRSLSQADSDRAMQDLPTVIEKLRLGNMTIQNNIRVDESNVEIEMTYFQMSEGVAQELGADLLNNIGLNVEGTASFGEGSPKYAAVVNLQLSKIFNMMAEDGLVKNIHSSVVKTGNGIEGNIQFGETLVILKRGADRDSVEEKDVGHILRVTPSLLANSSVQLKLAGEVSELGSYDQAGNPRISRNAFGETITTPLGAGVVAAFHKGNRLIRVKGGTPFLRHVPIVNLVFGKDRFEDSVVYRGFVITPRLQNRTVGMGPSVSEQTDEIIEKIRSATSHR